MTRKFTAIVEEEEDGFVALCTQLDIASQGDSTEEAIANLKEAVNSFLETASEQEVKSRLGRERLVTEFEVACG